MLCATMSGLKMGGVEKGKKIFVPKFAQCCTVGKGKEAQDWAKSPWSV